GLRLLDGRDRRGIPALGGNAVQTFLRTEQDSPFTAPRAAGNARCGAEIFRRSACGIHFFQASTGFKSNRSAIRRPERLTCIIRAPQATERSRTDHTNE